MIVGGTPQWLRVVQALDNLILALAGDFATVDGAASFGFALISTEGLYDPLLTVNDVVLTICLDGDYLILGGAFSSITVDGAPTIRWGLAVLDVSGKDVALMPYNPIGGSTIISDLKIHNNLLYMVQKAVGGGASTICGVSRTAVAVLARSYESATPIIYAFDWPGWNSVDYQAIEMNITSSYIYVRLFDTLGRVEHDIGNSNPEKVIFPRFRMVENRDLASFVVWGDHIYVGGLWADVEIDPYSVYWTARVLQDTEDSMPRLYWKPSYTSTNLTKSGNYLFATSGFATFLNMPSEYAEYEALPFNIVSGSIGSGAVGTAYDKVYVIGSFTTISSVSRSRGAAYNNDPTNAPVITDWDPQANNTITGILLENLKVILWGSFTSCGGAARNYIARVSADTSGVAVADSWNPNLNSTVTKIIARINGGYYWLCGAFTSVDGVAGRRWLVAISDAGLWMKTVTINFPPKDILLDQDYRLYMTGEFTTIEGLTRNYAAAIVDSTGVTNVLSWAPITSKTSSAPLMCPIRNTSGILEWIALTGLTGVVYGDSVTYMAIVASYDNFAHPAKKDLDIRCTHAYHDNITNIFYARWSANWPVESRPQGYFFQISTNPWAPVESPDYEADAPVRATQVDNAYMYVGGDFTSFMGSPRGRLALITRPSGTDYLTDWSPNANDKVYTLYQTEEDIYAGGDFTNILSEPRGRLAQISKGPDLPILRDLDITLDDTVTVIQPLGD